MLQSLVNRLAAPRFVGSRSDTAVPFDRLRVLDQPFRRVWTAVEDDVLDQLLEFRLNLLVNGELAGIDDAHVEPSANRVIEKYGMNRLANHVVAAERKRNVGNA